MSNIAIFTVFRNTNYGAGLQAYALQHKLKEITDSDVFLIDYIKDQTTNLMHNGIFYHGRHDKKSINFISIKKTVNSIINYRGTAKRTAVFQNYIKKYLCVYPKEFYTGDAIIINNLEYVFLGSDQIWNPDVMKGFHDPYFGIIKTKAKKVIAYAPSLGKSSFSKQEEDELLEKLRNVDELSCREENSCKYLEKLCNRGVKCVLDPTLLLSKKEWEEILDYNCKLPDKYVLVYSLRHDEELTNRAALYAKENGCKVLFLGTGKGKEISESIYCRDFGPTQFIAAVSKADSVFTDSFHGTVFSVLFNKRFVVRANGEKGQRMESLCNQLGISERLFREYSSFPDIKKKIDYKEVNSKLLSLRIESEKYIKDALVIKDSKLK